MALMDFIKKQFIDIIQWTEDDGETMAWRFPMAEMEIQNGASLTVRESQMAVFVNEGQIADVFGRRDGCFGAHEQLRIYGRILSKKSGLRKRRP